MKIEPQFIFDSKLRCIEYGIDPYAHPRFTKFLSNKELDIKRSNYDEILSVTNGFIHKLLGFVEGIPLLIIISDENGYVLEMAGDEAIRTLVYQSGIQVGLGFSEREAGTNSINLALDLVQPVETIGSDHYFEFLKMSACYTVPFRYLDVQQVLGTVTIMTSVDKHNPFLLPLLSTIIDSIERELLLRKQNRKLHILNQITMDTTRNGIIITDTEGKIIEFNKYAELITRKTKQEMLDTPLSHFEYGKIIQEIVESEKEFADIQFTFTGINGEPIICLADAFPIRDENQSILGGFVQFRDITERYLAEKQINYLAFHDELTGLPNRRFFHKYLTELLEESEDNKSIFAVMFIDLDRFKIINDNLGHNHGDVILKMVADRIRSILDQGDMVARMGGDEFTILFQKLSDVSDAKWKVERLIQEFQRPFNLDGYELFVTASIGIAFYPHDGTNANVLMKHADIAMYRAKEHGKNNYMVYKPTKSKGLDQLTLESSLRKALQNKEFELYYQPQMNTETGRMIGAEALLRWKHPTKGVISPAIFIPLAEESGLIVPIGEWVIEEACRQFMDWRQYDPDFKISVNLSARQFLKQDLVEKIRQVLLKTNMPPDCLELEITESMTMDVDHAKEILRQLKDLGVKVSIDDFGTGYSNLYYLKKFSVDNLKIDQSFVRDIVVDKNDADIVATIIAMAHSLGIGVIAEGVETKEQLDFLVKHGCRLVQGYLFHRPLSVDQLTALLTGQIEE